MHKNQIFNVKLFFLMLVFTCLIVTNNTSVNAQTIIETIELEPGYSNGSIAIAVNCITNRIYLANSCSSNVSVIDGMTNEVITTIAVRDSQIEKSQKGVEVNSSTNLIYVANSASNNVSVIDGFTEEVIDTINNVENNGEIAVNPTTNLIYIANVINNTIIVIDGSINKVIGTVLVGNPPGRIGINTATNRIYVSHFQRDNVSVIDGSTNQVIATVEVGMSPRGIEVNAVTNRIYLANTGFCPISNSVIVIDGLTNNVIDNVRVMSCNGGFSGESLDKVIVNPTANHIYVIEEEFTDVIIPVRPRRCPKFVPGEVLRGDVKVIDGLTNQLIATDDLGFDMGFEDIGIGVNPNTNLIYVTNGFTGNILVILDESGGIPTPTPAPVLTALIVSPTFATKSLRLNEAIVTALDQNAQPLSDIIVNASASEQGAKVRPAFATTDTDGTAKFKFRFGFVTRNGEITFSANGLSVTIVQED